jgi:3-oxoacyl-[acyl-carrier-protein] synthase-3
MAVFNVPNVEVKGIAACVPKYIESNQNYLQLNEDERRIMMRTTGVEERRKCPKDVCSSDLCYEAAKKLIQDLNWKAEEIGLLIFVSQSPDYYLPATACVLQKRLGLPLTSIVFDVGLGCSGYVYGLSIVGSLMANSGIKRALLLAGDVSTTSLMPGDKSTYPLFGDAGTATAIEYNAGAKGFDVNLQSDGNRYEAIMIPDGGCRNPLNDNSYTEVEIEPGITRSKKSLWLNGMDVFSFSVTEVPVNVNSALAFSNTGFEEIDYFVMHQANLLMNETIRKKLKVDATKVPYSLKKFGNTSSASIPLTIVTELKGKLAGRKQLLLTGFGVGLSWGSVLLTTDNPVISELVEI